MSDPVQYPEQPDIAAQLAWRDAAIEQLRAEVARLGEELDVANTALGQAATDCVEQSFRAEKAEAEAAQLRAEKIYVREADRRVGQQFMAAQEAEARALTLAYERLKEFKRAEEAEAEAAQLRAEKEAAERDAARYRWLRGNCKREWESDMPHDKGAPSLDIDFSAPGHDLDAAIDAAMHQEQTP